MPLQAGEGRSNNSLKRTYREKAALLVCLFLFPLTCVYSQEIVFDANLLEAHRLALNLRPDDALRHLQNRDDIGAIYVASLAEAIELLITEDNTRFSEYEERFHQRVDRNVKGSARDYQFLQAEIRTHWAFIYLKFGHELDGALQLRQAYQIAESCREKFPDYLPIRKTSGLLRLIVGSIPDKYNWVLSLLNMSGTISGGLEDLRAVSSLPASPFSLESKILYALVQGFLLADPGSAVESMNAVLAADKGNRLAMFFNASLALKSSRNDVALELLDGLSQTDAGIPLYYADYLRGEANLHKGDYMNALAAYRWFIEHQPGQNYIKDAHYKIGLCYWLNGNESDAFEAFKEARSKGKEATEADKSAAHALADKDLPNIKLTKVRFLTDGGYYSEADAILSGITSMDLLIKRDQIEYLYRKARLLHKTGSAEAEKYYLDTINMTAQENWYFAPNASLQLGYIYQSQNKIAEAEDYFRRALSYRRHEYKNSIDSKARSALAQLTRM